MSGYAFVITRVEDPSSGNKEDSVGTTVEVLLGVIVLVKFGLFYCFEMEYLLKVNG